MWPLSGIKKYLETFHWYVNKNLYQEWRSRFPLVSISCRCILAFVVTNLHVNIVVSKPITLRLYKEMKKCCYINRIPKTTQTTPRINKKVCTSVKKMDVKIIDF